MLMLAILLYPGIMPLLSKKNAYDKVGNVSKSYFISEQKMDWIAILRQELFMEDQDFVAELLDVEPESV